MPVFHIKGTNRQGETVYYTGKSGETAISKSRAYAKVYVRNGPDSEAYNTAMAMNKGQKHHGVQWEIVEK